MWIDEAVFYQIYPLGFCGAPRTNDNIAVNRIAKVIDWIPHLKTLNINAVYFSPVFSSDTHGYDTRDYTTIDCRLGSNTDFAAVCRCLHEQGIRVVLDGVFNHVGRSFAPFCDVLEHRYESPYKDWFCIDFNGNSPYNDGLYYEGWEGHYELVKLNLCNHSVVEYLLSCIKQWYDEFGIDGLRLDVAYCLNRDFLRELHTFTRNLSPDFALIGEVLFGDYNQLVTCDMLDSCTNYECYKGLYSSFNEMNLFEITYSLNRQFGSEPWTLYKNKHLLSFCDNHDVSRLASILKNRSHLKPAYALLFGMPGIPCIYYGSEWGIEGEKTPGNDDSLRPCIQAPIDNDLSAYVAVLALLHRTQTPLTHGDYRNVIVTNRQCLFVRSSAGKTIYVAVNADDSPYTFTVPGTGLCTELITKSEVNPSEGFTLPGFSAAYLLSC